MNERTPPPRPPRDGGQRLQKVLAAAGVGSRRQCEELIVTGRVEVDREIITALGTRIDPTQQAIRVDGVAIKRPRRAYFALNKPRGVVSTSNDPWGRPRVIDLIDAKERLFTIGRLDKESSGLILVTNDGELANHLAHPRYEVEKTYQVTVAGYPSIEVIGKLRRGVMLSEGPVRPTSAVIKKRMKQSTLLEIVLTEGQNREIRRMLARLGHKVLKLHRIAIGPVRLGMLPAGAHRALADNEIAALKKPPQVSDTRRTASSRTASSRTAFKGRKPHAGRTRKQTASTSKTKRKTTQIGGVAKKRSKDAAETMGTVIGGSKSSERQTRIRSGQSGAAKPKPRRRKSTRQS